MIFGSIKLEGNQFDGYINVQDKERFDELKGLSNINVFVGENNSGKSRFMREICKIEEYEFTFLDHNKYLKLIEKVNGIHQKIESIDGNWYNESVISMEFITEKNGRLKFSKNELSKLKLSNTIQNNSLEELKNAKQLLEILSIIKPGQTQLRESRGIGGGNNAHVVSIANNIISLINDAPDLIEEFKSIIQRLDKFLHQTNKFYYPIFRSLNTLDEYLSNPEKDHFESRIRKIYGFESENINLFTGQNLYKEIRSMLLGDQEEREKISKFQIFLGKKIFGGKKITLIPKEKDDVIHVSIDGNEKAIYDLGDGIQSLIILTYPIFSSDFGMFFIEEPELTLHPGMQRKLIEVMLDFPNHQYFLTTHSNHLLDLTLDFCGISIYRFDNIKESDDKKQIEQVEGGDHSLLASLGVRNSSVFLANSTIWVEGITDRLYLKKMMQVYLEDKSNNDLESISEDIDYTFVEYGGGNITHRSFLDEYVEEETVDIEHLCAKAFLIVDNDDNKAPARKEALKEKLGDSKVEEQGRYYELECNEIENLLSLEVLKNTVNEFEGGNSEWKNFSQRADPEYPHKNKKIGKFIEEDLFKAGYNYTRRGGYKSESGTIKGKTLFCTKAIQHIKIIEDLTDEAKDLCQKIYEFIISQKVS